MWSKYQVTIANLYNIYIGNVKKLVPNFLIHYELHYQDLKLYLMLGLNLKKCIVYYNLINVLPMSILFDNDLVEIHKGKVSLKLDISA